MKHLFIFGFLFLFSCEKQEIPISNEVDTLNLKKAEPENFINIVVDSTMYDTIIVIKD